MIPVGGPAKGKDFIDREKETSYILKRIQKDNVLLIAPRRYGKTSVMRNIESRLLMDNIPCIYLDVMSVESPQELIRNIVEEIGRIDNPGILGKISGSYNRLKTGFDESVKEFGGELFKISLNEKNVLEKRNIWKKLWSNSLDVFCEKVESRFYIILDEFPSALQNMNQDDAKIFLQYFRRLRLKCSERVGFLVGGSVSIDSVIHDIDGPGLINDFKRYSIEGFDYNIAHQLIIDCLTEEQIPYDTHVPEKILDCIGEPYIPYFIAVVLDSVLDEYQNYQKTLNEAIIEKIYHNYLLGNKGKHYFDHYYERLGKTYKNNEKVAKLLLQKIALTENYPYDLAKGIYLEETGNAHSEIFKQLFSELENDFYIVHDLELGILRFHSKILRDWWRTFHADE